MDIKPTDKRVKPDHTLSRRGRYARAFRSEGRCAQCGQPAVNGMSQCQPCREARNARQKKTHYPRVEAPVDQVTQTVVRDALRTVYPWPITVDAMAEVIGSMGEIPPPPHVIAECITNGGYTHRVGDTFHHWMHIPEKKQPILPQPGITRERCIKLANLEGDATPDCGTLRNIGENSAI